MRLGRRATIIALATITGSGMLGIAAQPAGAITGPSQVWSKTYSDKFVESSPNVANLDGQQDILVGNHDGKLYAVHPDGTDVGGWPVALGDGIDSSPAAADVDGNGSTEVFVGSGTPAHHSGNMWGLTNNGQVAWKFHGSDAEDANISMFSSPAIGDVNYDGVPDVSGFSLGLKGWSFNARTGGVNSGWEPWYQDDSVFSSPALMDVDGDGVTDYVVGGDSAPGAVVDNRGGVLRAVRGDGSVIWQFLPDEIVRSSPTIADIDGDGQPEIIVGTGDYWVRQPGGASDSNKLWVLDRNGHVKWWRDLGAYAMASPAIADVDGNGTLDIIEGTWEGGNPGKVWVYDGHGNTLANWNGRASGGGVVIGQISTADFDNDGGQDLMVPTGGGVFVYSGKTGASLFSMQAGQSGYQNTPWVGDLDSDGRLDIVIAGGKPNGQGVLARYEMPDTTAKLGARGWHMFRGDARHTGSWLNVPLAQDRCADNPGEGYLLSGADGGIFSYCAPFHGSMGGQRLAQPVVGVARQKNGTGYWQVARDGGIFAFGAPFKGSMGGSPLNQPIVGMTSTPSGNGYWMVARDGGIFSFGDAQFYGSMGGSPLNQPIVGMATTPTGHGYWLAASDGGIFSYGDANFFGSTGGTHLNQPVVAMTPTASGHGYWLVASDGGIFSYGDAQFHGSMGGQKLNMPIVSMATAANGSGYRLVASDGGIFSFDAVFLGSAGSLKLNSPIIGMS